MSIHRAVVCQLLIIQLSIGFKRALRSIHRAGVRHNDIRPENLLATEDGKVTIIDFDRAVVGASRGARQRERGHLDSLFANDFLDPGTLPSPRTPSNVPSSDSSGS